MRVRSVARPAWKRSPRMYRFVLGPAPILSRPWRTNVARPAASASLDWKRAAASTRRFFHAAGAPQRRAERSAASRRARGAVCYLSRRGEGRCISGIARAACRRASSVTRPEQRPPD